MRRLLLAVLLSLCAAVPALIVGGTAQAVAAACSGTVQITSLTFDRPSVGAGPGQGFTATATLLNCTDQAQQVTGYWLARSVMPPDVPYSFCTGNDPFPISAQIAAGATYPTNMRWDITNPRCAATALHVTVNLNTPPTSLGADIPVDNPPPSCTATYQKLSEWAGGFVAQVTVSNPTASAFHQWTVTFSFPATDQHVTSAWGATVRQNGDVVTATDLSWDATIPAGSSVTFGLVGTWHSSDYSPAALSCQAS